MEDKIKGFGNGQVIIQRDFDQLKTELQEAHTQISEFQREQIRHDDEIVLTRVRTSTLEIPIEDIQNLHQNENPYNDMSNKFNITKMAPKRTSTSAAPTMTQTAIRKLVTGTEGAVGLIRWFERTEFVFSRNNYTEDCKVKFATGTLTREALSWWNSFTQPIGIEEAYKIT
ncbi:hypothetical protein Tco_1177575 [Tanacetum coccineum]